MTREEARIELCVAQADVWHRPSDDAIDMAIEALELVTSYEDTINKLTEAIANTTRPKGEWRVFDKGIKTVFYNSTLKCTNCNHEYNITDGERCWYKHCPNCGAKMVEPQESEDKEGE